LLVQLLLVQLLLPLLLLLLARLARLRDECRAGLRGRTNVHGH
tara:strand:- start:242 stop:370 length:129 start_codon:yes stop_codon:yes gene_type:complete